MPILAKTYIYGQILIRLILVNVRGVIKERVLFMISVINQV